MAITKTGVEVDTNNTFENADVFEENGAVNSITVSGLNADTSYYVRAYVIQDGNKIYGSDVETFETESEYSNEYFFIENEYNGQNTFTLKKSTYADIQNIEWSKDKSTWTAFDLSQSQNDVVLEDGEKLYLRNDSGYLSEQNYPYTLNCSENYSVGGNINTLLNYNDLSNVTLSNSCFYRLFYNSSKLISANNLVLPSTTLAQYCYKEMFRGCSSLVTVPKLPATTLAGRCYEGMFFSCTSLVNAPKLKSTELAVGCYSSMFNSCSLLTTAPELPATALASDCYFSMFRYCSSLTEAPVLQATTLVDYCYQYMFDECSSLSSITTYANDNSATRCIDNWLRNVAASGTFHNLGSATYPSGTSGIPSGWTEVHN